VDEKRSEEIESLQMSVPSLCRRDRNEPGTREPRRARAALIAAPLLLVASCAPQSEQEPPAASLAAPGSVVAQAPLPQATTLAMSSTAAGDGGAGAPRASAGEKVRALAASIAAELAERCPVRDPADQTAYETCRKAMFGGSRIRGSLAAYTHWGRQSRDPEKTLKETNLTQFGPDVLTGMYLPLFMFTGKQQVTYDTREKLYRVELGARFRNRLQPGQFPYPFWHEDEKWTTYENANAILLWVDPRQMIVRTAQFTARGTLAHSIRRSC